MEGFLDKVRCDLEHQTEKMFSHRQLCLKELYIYKRKNSILLCQQRWFAVTSLWFGLGYFPKCSGIQFKQSCQFQSWEVENQRITQHCCCVT